MRPMALRPLEDVTAARACLLDPESKAEYDAALSTPDGATAAAIDGEPVAVPADGQRAAASTASSAGPSIASRQRAPSATKPAANTAGKPAAKPAARPASSSAGKPALKPVAARAILPDDPIVDSGPVDDMSFLDGLHDSSSGSAATGLSGFGAASYGAVAAKAGGKAPSPAATKGKSAAGLSDKPALYGSAAVPGRKAKWQPQPWQIGAIAGGGLLFVIAVIGIAMSMQGSPSPAPAPSAPAAAPVAAPTFGPGTFDEAKAMEEAAAKRNLPLGRSKVAVPLVRKGDFFLTAVTINGQPAGNFLVDTGAAATAISQRLADQLKLPAGDKPARIRAVGGAQRASFRTIDTLHVGAAKFPNLQAVVIDLGPWQKKVGVEFDGVLGCDVWRELMFCIDPEELKLTFYERDLKNPISDRAEFLTVMDDRPFISVHVDGGPELQYMAATGCSDDLMRMPASGAGQGARAARVPRPMPPLRPNRSKCSAMNSIICRS